MGESLHPLRRWRLSRKLTLAEAAGLLGVGKSSLSAYETGQKLPRAATMAAIRRVTGGEVTPNNFYPEPAE